MNDYETILWCINEEKKAPIGVDRYYPLMKRILINTGYYEKKYISYTSLGFFNYVIEKTCKTVDGWSDYYEQTMKVIKTFDKLYKEDKDKAMNINIEDFIKMIKEGV